MLKKTITLFITALFLGMVLVSIGCTRIQEPWVQSENQLQEERNRSPEMQKKLRMRLAETQIDQ